MKIKWIISDICMNFVMHCMLIHSCLQTFESAVIQHFFSKEKFDLYYIFIEFLLFQFIHYPTFSRRDGKHIFFIYQKKNIMMCWMDMC